MIKGIDLSYYDGGGIQHDQPLAWDQYTWDFAFVKASEGKVIDSFFKRQWAAARGHTLRGAYHFFRPSIDPKEAAAKTIEILDGDLGELSMMFDLEAMDSMPPVEVLNRAKTWLSWYEQWTGIRPIIYSGPNFLVNILKVNAATAPWLQNYKLVLAQYPFDAVSPDPVRAQILHDVLEGTRKLLFPQPPAPFKRVSIYQWTGKGAPEDVPGYYLGKYHKLAVDFLRYNGSSREELIAEFGVTDIPPAPVEPPIPPIIAGDEMNGKVTNPTNLRSQATINSSDIGDLEVDDLVTYTTKKAGTDGRTWCLLTSAKRNDVDVLTTTGRKVSEVEVWAYAANIMDLPEPPPTPEPSSEYIIHVKDGVTRKFIPE